MHSPMSQEESALLSSEGADREIANMSVLSGSGGCDVGEGGVVAGGGCAGGRRLHTSLLSLLRLARMQTRHGWR